MPTRTERVIIPPKRRRPAKPKKLVAVQMYSKKGNARVETTLEEKSDRMEHVYVGAGAAGVKITLEGDFLIVRGSDDYDSETLRLRAW
jgi:hypothetical protein